MFRFIVIVTIMSVIGLYLIYRLLRQTMFFTEDYRKSMESGQDMIEMQAITNEKEYLQEPGKILLPQGY